MPKAPNHSLRKLSCSPDVLLGLQQIIWLPGIKDKDITAGHTDFYVRFVRPGVVVVGYDPDPASGGGIHCTTQQEPLTD